MNGVTNMISIAAVHIPLCIDGQFLKRGAKKNLILNFHADFQIDGSQSTVRQRGLYPLKDYDDFFY